MTTTRWWSLAVGGGLLVSVAILFANQPEAWRIAGGCAVLAVYLVAWLTIGVRVICDEKWQTPYIALVIVLTAAATFIHPSLATLQVISYPLVWIISSTLRRAIVANVVLAVAVGIAYAFSYGLDLPTVGEAALVVALSLAFSLAMGFWISRIVDTSLERQRLLDELQAAQGSVAILNREAGVTSERERLAREIHDTIAQELTGLVLLAQASQRELSAGRTATASEQLVLLEDSARTALAEARALVASTAPVGLTESGIAPALERLADRFTRETGTLVTLETDVTAALDRDTEVVLLRCVQESLSNVRKHARAATIAVSLTAEPGGSVTLVVRDDGTGFDPEASTDGFGLAGMRDRLALVGGTLSLSSSPAGTELIATLPAVTT